MAQASKHVEWCLRKANKEIEECKKLGKRPKHRGLLKSGPDLEEAEKHLVKAKHNLDGITKFKEIGFSDWSMSTGFYCIYHCFLAIAAKFGYGLKIVIAVFSMLRISTTSSKDLFKAFATRATIVPPWQTTNTDFSE